MVDEGLVLRHHLGYATYFQKEAFQLPGHFCCPFQPRLKGSLDSPRIENALNLP